MLEIEELLKKVKEAEERNEAMEKEIINGLKRFKKFMISAKDNEYYENVDRYWIRDSKKDYIVAVDFAKNWLRVGKGNVDEFSMVLMENIEKELSIAIGKYSEMEELHQLLVRIGREDY